MSWNIYRKSADAWGAMLEDVRSATTTIDIEQYIFANDEIGKQFLEIFREKIKSGVRVRMLLDGVGSDEFMQDPIVEKLREEGIEVRFFYPPNPWWLYSTSQWFLRDHSKILIVDSRVAHVGGVGIEQRMEHWRDTHVRFSDEAVPDVEHWFFKMRERARKHRVKFRKRGDGGVFTWLTNAPQFRARFIYHALIRAIRGARRSVYITVPYIVPSVRLINVIRRARRRGVDVRLIVPKISDVPIVDIASGSYFTLLLKWGVRIFQYGPEMLHAKTVVVDDEWATVGSANLDNLSLLFNFEGNIATRDAAFASEIKSDALRDMQHSHEITHDEWIARPLKRKVLEILTWPLHGVL